MACECAPTKIQMRDCALAFVVWTGGSAVSRSTWRKRIQSGYGAASGILNAGAAFAESQSPCEASGLGAGPYSRKIKNRFNINTVCYGQFATFGYKNACVVPLLHAVQFCL